tara:strand:- start:22 stop:426 length:405 start_codon:yes stop_codon:yes gene_type:complete
MLEKVNHIAIAVPNLSEAILNYKNTFNCKVSKILELPNHGVITAFISLQNTNIELLEPLGENSPIKRFLEKNKNGGIHHICYEVKDINLSIAKLIENNCKILGDGIPREGAHGKPVIFIHPKNFNGTLIELEQI